VRAAVAELNAFGRKAQFEVSVRVMTRVGARLPDSDPETTLQGDVDAILRRIQQYGAAAVDRIVIEPVSTDLDAFLGQLEQFARQIMPQFTRASALQSASEANNNLMDPALLPDPWTLTHAYTSTLPTR
jgi:hypothetical protein